MAFEQHRVVIDVDYIGDAAINRFLADLQRLGAISAAAQSQITAALSAPTSAPLAAALGVAASEATRFGSQASIMARDVDYARAAVARLNTEMRQFQDMIVRAQSAPAVTSGMVQGLREQALTVLVQNQVNAMLGQMPGGRGSAFGVRPNPLPGLPGGPGGAAAQADQVRAVADNARATREHTRAVDAATVQQRIAEKVQRRWEQALESQTSTARSVESSGRRLAAAQDRAANDLLAMAARAQAGLALAGQLQMGGVGPLALPAGGVRPRTTDYGLPGPSRFLARDRAMELAQDRYRQALNERSQSLLAMARAERRQAVVAATSSAYAEFGKPAGGLVNQVSGVSFAGGVNPQLTWQLVNQEAQRTAEAALSAVRQARDYLEYARIQQQGGEFAWGQVQNAPDFEKQLNAFMAEQNRALLQAVATQYNRELAYGKGSGNDPRGSIQVAGELAELADRLTASTRAPKSGPERTLLYQGLATPSIINSLSPEAREYLIGDPRAAARNANQRVDKQGRSVQDAWGGVPVRGLMDRDAGLSALRDQYIGKEAADVAAAEAALRKAERHYERFLTLPFAGLGATQSSWSAGGRAQAAAYAAEVQSIRASIAAHEALTRELRRRVEAERAFQADQARLRSEWGPSGGVHGTAWPLPSNLLPIGQETVRNAQMLGPGLYAASRTMSGMSVSFADPAVRFGAEARRMGHRGYLYELPDTKRPILDFTATPKPEQFADIARWAAEQKHLPAAKWFGQYANQVSNDRSIQPRSWAEFQSRLGYSDGRLLNQYFADKGYGAIQDAHALGGMRVYLHPEEMQPQLRARIRAGYVGDALSDPRTAPGYGALVHLEGQAARERALAATVAAELRLQEALRRRAAAEERAAQAALGTGPQGIFRAGTRQGFIGGIPMDSTPGWRTIGWHGATSPLPTDYRGNVNLLPPDQVRSVNATAYGKGLYIGHQSNPYMSHGYGLADVDGFNFPQGYLYRVQAPAGARFKSLEDQVTPREVAQLINETRRNNPLGNDWRYLHNDYLRSHRWTPAQEAQPISAADKAMYDSLGIPPPLGVQAHPALPPNPMRWRDLYGRGDAMQERANQLLQRQGYFGTTTTYGASGNNPYREAQEARHARLGGPAPQWDQLLAFDPSKLRVSLAQLLDRNDGAFRTRPSYLAGDPRAPYGSSYMPGRDLVPHPDFARSTWMGRVWNEVQSQRVSTSVGMRLPQYEAQAQAIRDRQLAAEMAATPFQNWARLGVPVPGLGSGPTYTGPGQAVPVRVTKFDPGAWTQSNVPPADQWGSFGGGRGGGMVLFQGAGGFGGYGGGYGGGGGGGGGYVPPGYGAPGGGGPTGPFYMDDEFIRLSEARIRGNYRASGGGSWMDSTQMRSQERLAIAEARLAIATENFAQARVASYTSEAQRGVAYLKTANELSNATNAHAEAQRQNASINQAYAQAHQARLSREAANAPLTGAMYGPFQDPRAYGRGGVWGATGSGGRGGPPPVGPYVPGTGGLWDDFKAGFHGRQDKGYMEQFGQAAKFSVFYGTAYKILFAITQTLQATLQEGIAWQQAMADLKLATGRSKDELDGISNELGQLSVRAGFAPSQAMEIGARAVGLYGVTDSSAQDQDRVMRMSAQVVSQLAVGAKKDPVTLQGDIAAIAQALQLGPSGQFQIADLDAFMTKRFGIQQGSTLETVAQSASVGIAAGFTPEQLFAIAANMQSRTGQTSSAVAGFMAQIFSRGGEGSLVDVASRLGVDPDQELAQIIKELSVLYKDAAPREQAEISAAFGRGKIQNAAVALLSDYDEVEKRAREASRGGAVGAADKQFDLRMNNIGGQIAQLQGVLKDFASQLGESGLLDVLGLAIITFREFLEAVNGVLRVWNMVPDSVQRVVVGLGLLHVATRALTAAKVGEMLVSRGAVGGAVAAQTLTGWGRAQAGLRGLASIAGPAAIAVGGLLAVGAIKNSMDRIRTAGDAAVTTLTRGAPGPTASASTLRSYQGELRSSARANEDATGFWHNLFTFGQANDEPEEMARRLRQEARRIGRLATARSQEEGAYVPPTIGAFKGTSVDDLKTGLESLQESGASAGEQFRALRDALFGSAEAAREAREEFNATAEAQSAAGDLVKASSNALKGFSFNYSRNADGREVSYMPRSGQAPDVLMAGQLGTGVVRGKDLQAPLAEFFTGSRAARRYETALAASGVSSMGDIDEATANKIAEYVGSGIGDAVLEDIAAATGETKRELQERINAELAAYLLRRSRSARELLTGEGPLTAEDVTFSTQQFVSQSDARMNLLPQTDLSGRRQEAARLQRTLRRLQREAARRGGNAPTELFDQIDVAQRRYARARFEELEALRKTAQQNAGSKAEIQAIGRRFLNRAIAMAVRNRDADVLADIIGNAGKASIGIAKSAIDAAIQVADASLALLDQMRDALASLQGQALEMVPFVGGLLAAIPDAVEGKRDTYAKDRRRLKGLRKGLGSMQYDPENTSVLGKDSLNPNLDDWYGAGAEEVEEERDKPWQIAAARSAAYASRSESQVGAARAAIQQAKANIRDAEKNTVEYWNAMGELFAAQNSLVDALQAFQKNRMILRSDITNPLQQARIESRAAAIRLREDIRSGAGADVIAQDRVDLRSARANQEATAFSQRLSAVQTAEELGRISHSKYINYLENEKNRLEKIKNRTFQQQEHLNTIDRALKDATSSMDGMFNLGDVNVRGFVYRARRYLEEQKMATSARQQAGVGVQNTTNNNVTLTINTQLDAQKVRRVVEQYVTKPGATRTAQARRRH